MQVTNASFSLSGAYQKARTALEGSMVRLATGDRFKTPGREPAADLSISERLRGQIARANASTSSDR